jgi:hypothetical protein
MTPYNGYLIEPFESSPGRWRVRVRRQDGSNIETIAGAFASITTGGVESLSADDAVTIAKGMIDGLRRQDGQHASTRH